MVSDSAAADVSEATRALITVSCAVGKVGLREAVPLLVSTTESASRGLNADLGPSTWSNLSLAISYVFFPDAAQSTIPIGQYIHLLAVLDPKGFGKGCPRPPPARPG